jgi:hypothetical protein
MFKDEHLAVVTFTNNHYKSSNLCITNSIFLVFVLKKVSPDCRSPSTGWKMNGRILTRVVVAPRFESDSRKDVPPSLRESGGTGRP